MTCCISCLNVKASFKRLTIIIYLSFFLNAQFTTPIADDNFEAYLEANGMGNGVSNDNLVLTAIIDTVDSLNISYQNISDLSGIEGFSSLEYLKCSNNDINSLDLSQNSLIKKLYCVLRRHHGLEYLFTYLYIAEVYIKKIFVMF